MMLDVIAVIFIVALSFILCMKDGNNNCQISHIVIGLSVMVFYKLAKLLKLNQITKESFNTTSDLNAFISGNVVGNVVAAPNQLQTLSTSDLAAYNSKLDSLITAINNLYNQQNNPQPNLSVNPANIQKLDLESQQQYQMFQIDYLNKQLQNAKDIINTQTMANNNTNYKPIKVYNSCVISNADGTTTIDTPINSTKSSSTAFLQPSIPSNSSNLESGMNTYPITNRNNMTTINSAKSNNFVNLSPSTGAFGNLLNSLSNGQGNININL
jgi:hypothetical protein